MSFILLNAFQIYDTHGLPLSLQLGHGKPVSIPLFYRDALRAGWKMTKVLTTIREALTDNGADRVDERLLWLENNITRDTELGYVD